jgi:hypothetical protein
MKTILSERNIVIALFIMVLVTFSLAQEDTKKMERGFASANAFKSPDLLLAQKAAIPTSTVAE